MDSHDSFPFLKEIILFLALSGVLMPLLSRLKINPVLGFLSVGVLLGPYGLASLAQPGRRCRGSPSRARTRWSSSPSSGSSS